MHHIQYKIVAQLMTAPIRRFSELKPDGVESNLFQYHLKHTIKEGYVLKIEGGYTLSSKGLYFADRHSATLKTVREQPKIITIIILRNKNGEVFLHQKQKQPFVNTYHLPAGKIHENESVMSAAYRELYEKTGLESIELGYHTTVHVRIHQDGELVSEYIGFIYQGVTEREIEHGLWINRSQNHKIRLAPSVGEILNLGDDPIGAPVEITIDL